MAGLLDFLNQGGGLLGEEEQRRAQQAGLMGLAQGLLGAGQPSRIPMGFGAALGQGLGGYAQAQGDAASSALKEKAMGQQFAMNDIGLQKAKSELQREQDWYGGGQTQMVGTPQPNGTVPMSGTVPGATLASMGVPGNFGPEDRHGATATQMVGYPQPNGEVVGPAGPAMEGVPAAIPAAMGMSGGPSSLFDRLPPDMKQYVRQLGPTEGRKFLAGLAAKQMETGEYVDAEQGGIKGQRNTRTGEFKPFPASTLSEQWKVIPGTNLQENVRTGERKTVDSRSSTTINMPSDDGLTEYWKTLGKKLPEQESQARAAVRTNTSLAGMVKMGDSKTYSGTLAPGAIGASQFLESLGVKHRPETLSNTREFEAQKNILVLDFMASMGGARGFSKEESAVLYDAFPKIIDSPESRSRIAKMLINRNNLVIEDYNSTLDQFEKASGKKLPSPRFTTGTALSPSVTPDAARAELERRRKVPR